MLQPSTLDSQEFSLPASACDVESYKKTAWPPLRQDDQTAMLIS